MNKHLRAYAEKFIKEKLEQCTDAQVNLFIRMNSDPLKGPQGIDDVLRRMGPIKISDHMELVEQWAGQKKEETEKEVSDVQVTHSEAVTDAP